MSAAPAQKYQNPNYQSAAAASSCSVHYIAWIYLVTSAAGDCFKAEFLLCKRWGRQSCRPTLESNSWMAGEGDGAGLVKLRWLRSLLFTPESIKSLSTDFNSFDLLTDLLLGCKERLLYVCSPSQNWPVSGPIQEPISCDIVMTSGPTCTSLGSRDL